MRAGDMAKSVSAGQNSKTKSQRDTDITNADVRDARRQNGSATPPEYEPKRANQLSN